MVAASGEADNLLHFRSLNVPNHGFNPMHDEGSEEFKKSFPSKYPSRSRKV